MVAMQTLLLAAAVVPVLGTLSGTDEAFSGSIRGNDITLTSAATSCRGRLTQAGDYGSGSLTCADGRFGHFSFNLAGGMGTGHGRLGSKDLSLVFG